MLTETITLQVESEVARFYNEAPQTDKQKLQALFGSWLKQYSEADVHSLKKTMDEISNNAQSRVLTPEILEPLLADLQQAIEAQTQVLSEDEMRQVLNFMNRLRKNETKPQTLGELIDECFKDVPSDVMDKLPEDASLNLDHYLYGAPKK